MWQQLSSATIKKSTYGLLILISCLCFSYASGQQYVIANKDNTHPEITDQTVSPAFISSFSVLKGNGYNEISWLARREDDTRKYIVEYSLNGTDYEAAGEMLAGNGSYTFKHVILDPRPMIYRVKMEQANNKSFYAGGIISDGVSISPVQMYPTIIHGNTININAFLPVEKIIISSGTGARVYAKDINGQRDLIPIVIPSFGKGIYWITFYGKGWKTTEKFIVP
jgi:hypothetical protein